MAREDAPNYRFSEESDNCSTCIYGQEGAFCELYDFNYDQGWICDSWEATMQKQRRPGETEAQYRARIARQKTNKSKVFKAECEVTGVDEGLGIVFGWGMITEVGGQPYYDTDNQHITNNGMVKATSDFMENSRISNDMHTENDIGVVVHSFPITPEIAKSMGIYSNISGWMVGVKPDSDTLTKFADGSYTGFSIEGSAEWVDEEGE